MTRLISGFIFYIFYFIMYMSPIIIPFLICESLNIDVSPYLERLGAFRKIIGFFVLIYMMILPGYRAKLASEEFGIDTGFWEAHKISGVILKTHLSFLPIIGPFFNKEN